MENLQIFEPILFTNIVEREFMDNKPSEIIPIARYLGAEINLNIKTQFEQITNELIKRIKWN
jgi:hypothetical protein